MNDLKIAKDLIDKATNIFILTGAGISTDSGIPDFRGPKGLWTLNPQAELATNIQNFMKDPLMRREIWLRYYFDNKLHSFKPNDGHKALAKLAETKNVTIATQNIDGLHTKAGSENVIELHGTLTSASCTACGKKLNIGWCLAEIMLWSVYDVKCDDCSGIVKPNVVFFGELLDNDLWDTAENAAKACDLVIAIGTTLEVTPASNLISCAIDGRDGAELIILNKGKTIYDPYAAALLPLDISSTLKELTND